MVLFVRVRQIQQMKVLNQPELESLVDWISSQIQGAQFQEVFATETGLVLGLYLQKSYSLLIDLQNSAPFIGLFPSEKCPWAKSRITKPMGLFLNSHGKNLYLTEMKVRSELGRVVDISFQNTQKKCELEFSAIPRRANLRCKSEGKALSWAPWKELDQNLESRSEDFQEVRSVPELLRQWQESLNKKDVKVANKGISLERFQKDLQKKQKARMEIIKTIEMNAKDSEIMYMLGEELKQKELSDFKKTSFEKYLDYKKSKSINREKCFSLAKSLLKKNEGAQLRTEKLDHEILALQDLITKIESNRLTEEDLHKTTHDVARNQLAKHKISEKNPGIKSRKMVMNSGATVFMGKSAKDNIALLRQARAWDYWLHLRDYPGAHAIIHREKNQNINTNEFQSVAKWLAEESLSAKSLQKGLRLDVVIAEVRFVRPIKGDKLGKVNYHSERTLSFIY